MISLGALTACAGMCAQVAPGLPELLLWRSATVSGFFLLHYAALYRKHLQKLVTAWQAGKLHVALDSAQFRCNPRASNVLKERCMGPPNRA